MNLNIENRVGTDLLMHLKLGSDLGQIELGQINESISKFGTELGQTEKCNSI